MRRKALRSLAFGLCCALSASVGAYFTVTATSTEVQRSGPRATAKAVRHRSASRKATLILVLLTDLPPVARGCCV